jgi:hypothetical protein
MTSFPQRFKTLRFAVSVTIVVLLGVAVGVFIATPGKVPVSTTAQDGLPLVTSATSAIRVVALQRTTIGASLMLNVSLQNVSPKTIKAYSVGSGKGWVTRNYYSSEIAFPPNAIETQIIPLQGANSAGPHREFTVTGVLFEDGTTDGQAISVFRLKENWVGFRDYASRILPCLRKLPRTLAAEDETALANCETEASNWSVKGRSSDYEDGFHNAQHESLTQLNEIKSKIRLGDFSNAAKQRDHTIKLLETFQRP